MLKHIAMFTALTFVYNCGKKDAPKQPGTIGRTMYVSPKDGLNVREAPDKKSKRLATLPKGEKVTVLAEQPSDEKIDGVIAPWMQITNGKITGWAFGGFLSANPPEFTNAPSDPPNRGMPENDCISCSERGTRAN